MAGSRCADDAEIRCRGDNPAGLPRYAGGVPEIEVDPAIVIADKQIWNPILVPVGNCESGAVIKVNITACALKELVTAEGGG